MKRFISGLILLTVVASTAYGSIYGWNPKRRPPFRLQDVLLRAEKLLGKDAKNRYCIGAHLTGNRAGDGKDGIWHLEYGAADGSRKYVSFDESSEEVDAYSYPPIDWRGTKNRRNGLEDVAERINKTLKELGYTERASVKDGKLKLSARTRKYRVYPETKNGAYGDHLVETIGPRHDGVIIEATVVHDVSLGRQFGSRSGPYWLSHERNYILTGENRFLQVHIRYGQNTQAATFDHKNKELMSLLIQTFG